MPLEDRAPDPIHLACFEASGRTYALDVRCVREVVRWQPVTPLPGAPEWIEGVVDLGGVMVPVLDLGRLLDGQPCEIDRRARIAIVQREGLCLGLCVEAAVDVLSLDSDSVEAPPDLATQVGCGTVSGLVHREGGDPVIVLSLGHILEGLARHPAPAEPSQ